MKELEERIRKLFETSDALSRENGLFRCGIYEFGKANAYNNVLLLIKEAQKENS